MSDDFLYPPSHLDDPDYDGVLVSINRSYVGKPKEVKYSHHLFRQTKLSDNDFVHEICDEGHAFTAACTDGSRKKEDFISAQFFGLDFDDGDETCTVDYQADDPFNKKYAFLVYATVSSTPSHPRCRVVFKLSEPVTDIEKYEAIVRAFMGSTSSKVDESTKDGVRMWFGSPGCERKFLGNILPIEVAMEKIEEMGTAREIKEHKSIPKILDPETKEKAIKWAKSLLDRLDERRYDDYMGGAWVDVGMALCDLGDDGLQLWIEWSQQSKKYKPGLCEEKWKSFHPGEEMKGKGHTLGSLYHWAEEDDPHKDGKRRLVLSTEIIYVLNELGYTFKMDSCTDRIEANGTPVTDAVEDEIITKMHDRGYTQKDFIRSVFVSHGYHNAYHPVRDYLNSLKYDGEDHIHQLASYFENSDGTFEMWVRRWLIGSVQRAFKPGSQNRVLAIVGKQNIGKSYFASWLCPKQLHEKNFKSGAIYPHEKDSRIALMDRWIWEISELGATLRRTERDAIKQFLSLMWVSERISYDRYPTNKPALSNFIATANFGEGLLSDPTGSRRWMFSQIDKIDWAYSTEMNVDNIWAQANMLYIAGEPAELTPDEMKKADEINSVYERVSPLEGILLEHFEIDPTRFDWWTPTATIIEDLFFPGSPTSSRSLPIYRGTTDMAEKELSDIMTAKGCKPMRHRVKGSTSALMGYHGVKKL